MKLIELVREDQEDQDAYRATHRNAPMMHRKADDRPTVGDRRHWSGMSGALIKQAKRLEHIVDEIMGFDPNKADPIVIKRFQDAMYDLTSFASKIEGDYRNYTYDGEE